MDYSKLQSKQTVDGVIEALKKNGIAAELVNSKEEAKEKVLSLIPEGAEVMNMTSITLEQAGIDKALNESSKYKSVRKQLAAMDRKTQHLEMLKLGAAPEWSVGSVHAVTEDGKVMVASNTGSQLSGYVHGSAHVLWVISTNKIVKNTDEGLKRIQEYIVPQETQRARKAYGLPETYHTFISKLLIFNRETVANRIHIIFVNEKLGF